MRPILKKEEEREVEVEVGVEAGGPVVAVGLTKNNISLQFSVGLLG